MKDYKEKFDIELAPWGVGVESRIEAGYYGFKVGKKYGEFSLKEGKILLSGLRMIKKVLLQKTK